jgi:Ser/Thr protein kinase RdoA (MazF antagonist)
MDDMIRLIAADPVQPADVASVLVEHYGLAGELQRLPGEADDNFLLRTESAGRYVVKFAHPQTDPAVIDMQTRVLRHLESTEIPAQRVVAALSGELWVTPADRIVMVTSYLEGTPMREAELTAPLRREIGVTLALLGRALSGVRSDLKRPLLWDIAQLPTVRPLVDELPPQLDRTLLIHLIDRFEDRTEPRLRELRTQLVHNDFNVDNILVSSERGKIAGILDFGDMTVTALANDVAVAACYHLTGEDLLAPALDLIAAYQATTPLTEAEQALLPELILARLTARVAIPRWRAVRFPDNQEYILRSAAAARAQLTALLTVPDGEFAERIHAACEEGASQ